MTYLFKSPMIALALAGSLLLPVMVHADPSGNSIPTAPAALSVQGPASAQQAAPAPGAAVNSRPAVGSDDHIIVAGDLIEVSVFQEPDMDSSLRVAKDGSIVYPLIDRVTVGGLTPSAAAKVIQSLLNKDYLVNPQVALRVIEYAQRGFTVLGEVQKPGFYVMPDRSTVSLLEAIGMAGGYTRVANPSNVTVKRKVSAQEIIYRLNAKRMAASGGPTSSFEIQPNDVINVSESIF